MFILSAFRTTSDSVIIFASTVKHKSIKLKRRKELYSPTFLLFSLFLSSCCCSRTPSLIISFLFGYFRVGLLGTNSFSFFYQRIFGSSFIPEGRCHWTQNSGLAVLLIQNLKNVSDLHNF